MDTAEVTGDIHDVTDDDMSHFQEADYLATSSHEEGVARQFQTQTYMGDISNDGEYATSTLVEEMGSNPTDRLGSYLVSTPEGIRGGSEFDIPKIMNILEDYEKLATEGQYYERNFAIMAAWDEARRGIAGRGAKLVNYNEPPEFMTIMGSNGELILRAPIGTFEFIIATASGSESKMICHDFAHVDYMTSVIPINQIDKSSHEFICNDHIPMNTHAYLKAVDSNGTEMIINLVPQRGRHTLPTREVTDDDDDDMSTFTLNVRGSIPSTISHLWGDIEWLAYDERRKAHGIPDDMDEALQMDSDNMDRERSWYNAYIRGLIRATKRDGGDWIEEHDVADINIIFNSTDGNSPKCTIQVHNTTGVQDVSDEVYKDIAGNLIGQFIRSDHAEHRVHARVLSARIVEEEAERIPGIAPEEEMGSMILSCRPVELIPLAPHEHMVVEDTGFDYIMTFEDIPQDPQDDLVCESRARSWYKLLYKTVVIELRELFGRAEEEVRLYQDHMGIDISGNYLTFYTRYGKIIHGARAYELEMMELYKDASEGKVNSTRKKLNARIRNMMPTYDRIQAHVLKVPSEILIDEQRRTIVRPHTVMLYPSILPYLRMYHYGYDIVIEAIMFGNANRYRSLSQHEQHHEVVNYRAAIQNTATPYYDEVGHDDSSSDTSMNSSDGMLDVSFTRQSEGVRFRVVAIGRNMEIDDNHETGNDDHDGSDDVEDYGIEITNE